MEVADLFLSYHSPDREAVRSVRRLLVARGLTTFLDRESLTAGVPWGVALEEGLRSARAVAVFLGPRGLGAWQLREVWFALDLQARAESEGRRFPVVPVLLPGVSPADLGPGFLFLSTWVDLRDGLDCPEASEAIEALAQAITGDGVQVTGGQRAAICPYQGLNAFREQDAALFHGRKDDTKRLFDAVQSRDLVAVVGPSGSGKSSIVQAGLLPLIRRQRAPDDAWDVAVFTPGARPFHRLAGALIHQLEPHLSETERLKEASNLGEAFAKGTVLIEEVVDRLLERSHGTDRFLLVVDQLEELFAQTPPADQGRFIEALLRALDHRKLTLVVTLRADFYHRAIGLSRDLSDRMARGIVNLGPMREDELAQAISAPARLVGVEFADGLEDRIRRDVSEEPGNLPLLEFALTELWVRAPRGPLTHAAYDAIGGVAGAVARRADAEFNRLSLDEQAMAQRVFTRLVRAARPDEVGGDTRQRIDIDDLSGDLGSSEGDTRRLVLGLANARLLVTDRDPNSGDETVEVAHEALIREWEKLRGWVDEDREFLLWRQRLAVSLSEWERADREPEGLLVGARLTEAERWLAQRPDDLNGYEQDLIRSSTAERIRVECAATHRQRRIVLTWTAVALVGVLLASLALLQWAEANHQRILAVAGQAEATRLRKMADAQLLAARSQQVIRQSAANLQLGVLLGVEALRRDQSEESDRALHDGLRLVARERVGEGRALGARIRAVAFDPTGQFVAAATDAGTAEIWAAQADRLTTITPGAGTVLSIAYGPGGAQIATGSEDGTVAVWDTQDGSVVRRYAEPGTKVWAVALSPDGRLLAAARQDHSAVIWDTTTGERLPWRLEHREAVMALAFSPDSRRLATASFDRTVKVWDPVSGKTVRPDLHHPVPIRGVAFAPDSRTVASASDDGVVRFWDLDDDRDVPRLTQPAPVSAVAFSRSGLRIATASVDGTARVWDAEGKREIARLGHDGPVTSVMFGPDDDRVVTGSEDGSVRVWNVGRRELTRSSHDGLGVWSVAFDPDGHRLASGGEDGTARVWDTSDGRTFDRSRTRGQIKAVAFDPTDGRNVVVGSWDGSVYLWDFAAGIERDLGRHSGSVVAVAFSPDGRRVASGGPDGTARLWDAAGGEVAGIRLPAGSVTAVAFSADGRYLAIGGSDGWARLWNLAAGQEDDGFPHAGEVTALAFSPDDRRLLTGSYDGDGWSASVWDVAGRHTRMEPLRHLGRVNAVAFARDGEFIATGSEDRTVRMWDAETGAVIARLKYDGSIKSLALSSDGDRVATGSNDGTTQVRFWRPDRMYELACERVGRGLTHDEWLEYLRDEDPRPTCPNLP